MWILSSVRHPDYIEMLLNVETGAEVRLILGPNPGTARIVRIASAGSPDTAAIVGEYPSVEEAGLVFKRLSHQMKAVDARSGQLDSIEY